MNSQVSPFFQPVARARHAARVSMGWRMHAALLGMLLGGGAAVGQPQFAILPFDNVEDSGLVISRNSQYVAGYTQLPFPPFGGDSLFYDADSGLIRSRFYAHFIGEADVFTPTAVTDTGVVIGIVNGGFSANNPGRVARWDPYSGAYAITNPATTGLYYMIRGVTPDGRFGVGQSNVLDYGTALGTPVRFDFGPTFTSTVTTSQLGVNLQGEARVIIPRGPGLYDIWGPSHGAGQGYQATLWPLNNFGIGTRFPVDNVIDVSDDGTKILTPGGVWSETGFMALQGLGRETDVLPTSISADGRVVGGWTRLPGSQGTTLSTAVVWRDGPSPEPVITLLAAAGIDTGECRTGGNLTRISKDGTLIASRYAIILPIPGLTQRSFVAVIPPKNDGCVNARPITFGVYRDSLRGATSSMSSNVCYGDAGAPDVWYAFTPTSNEIVRLDTCGSDFDTTIAVYRGTAGSCGTTQPPIACSDNSNATFCPQNTSTSIVDFSAVVGSVYYVRLAGNFGTRGNAVLTVTPPGRPPNDTCGSALPIDAGFSREVNTTNATTDSRPGCVGSPLPFFDLWYRTVAPDAGRMTFSTCGSQGNFVVSVYGEDACGNGAAAPIACSGTSGCAAYGGVVTVPCSKDQVFYLRVGGAFGAQGAGGRINTSYSCDTNQLFDYNQQVLDAGPLGYWRLDDQGITTAADAVRSDPYSCGDHPGRYEGVIHQSGIVGNAAQFNFFVPNAGVRGIFVNSALRDATVEAWIKTTNPFAGDILQSRGASGEYGLSLTLGDLNEGEIAFALDGPNFFSFGARRQMPLNDDRWHHVVGTRQNTLPGDLRQYLYRLFVDGEPVAFSSQFAIDAQVETSADGPWVIGNRNIDPNLFTVFKGLLDEVAIYPTAQNGIQIADRFLAGTHGCQPVILNRSSLERFPPGFASAGGTITVSLDVRTVLPTQYQWYLRYAGAADVLLADGSRADGSVVSGATTPSITISNVNVPNWNRVVLEARAVTDCGDRRMQFPLTVRGLCRCQADFNCDFSIDADDLGDYITCYFATPVCAGAEFNGDGVVNADDLGDFITVYFTGCP